MQKKHMVRQYAGKKGNKAKPSAPINYLPAGGGGKKSKTMHASTMGKVASKPYGGGAMQKHSTRQTHMRKPMGSNGRA